jgi:hypothetical protein
LRKAFNLPEKASLALNSLDEIDKFNQAQAIADNNMASIQLNNALNPSPLAFRDNKKHINTDVIANTSLFTQLKYKQEKLAEEAKLIQTEQATTDNADKGLGQSFNFNAKAWLDGIEQSLVKAPLLS